MLHKATQTRIAITKIKLFHQKCKNHNVKHKWRTWIHQFAKLAVLQAHHNIHDLVILKDSTIDTAKGILPNKIFLAKTVGCSLKICNRIDSDWNWRSTARLARRRALAWTVPACSSFCEWFEWCKGLQCLARWRTLQLQWVCDIIFMRGCGGCERKKQHPQLLSQNNRTLL